MRIKIPNNLANYIRLKDGEIVFKKQLPKELEEEYKQFENEFKEIKTNFL